jgi:hypothetical protein
LSPASTASTCLAAVSVAARLVPTGRSWVNLIESCPDWSRKFVFRNVLRKNVTSRTATPMLSVAQRRLVANRITGR